MEGARARRICGVSVVAHIPAHPLLCPAVHRQVGERAGNVAPYYGTTLPLICSVCQKAAHEPLRVWQARYYREKLGVDTDGPAGRRAVVEAYIQVRAASACIATTPTRTAACCRHMRCACCAYSTGAQLLCNFNRSARSLKHVMLSRLGPNARQKTDKPQVACMSQHIGSLTLPLNLGFIQCCWSTATSYGWLCSHAHGGHSYAGHWGANVRPHRALR